MKKIVLGLLCILFLILDNTLMPFLAIETYYPSLLFVFVICYSIINGKVEGLIIGVVTGLLQDLYFGGAFGINALTNMLACVLAATIGEGIFKEKRLIPVAASFFITAIKGVMVFVLLYLTGQQGDIMAVVYISLYTMVVTIFMYKRVYNLSQKSFMKRDWKF
jgi:rod shape-determining protein MreD